jgi:hypothetical protein
VLVFGCAYERIADERIADERIAEEGCSATTLCRRQDEWIEAGVMARLRELALEAYHKLIGLQLSDVAVDCCITKAPCGGEKAGRNPADRGRPAGPHWSGGVSAEGAGRPQLSVTSSYRFSSY